MAIRRIDKNNIPLTAYLRADPHSQHFEFTDNSGELVSSEMFWGNAGSKKCDRIYLDYSSISNKSIEVSEGISENNSKQKINNNCCEKWIDNNILNKEISRLFVIQGYAGCGKTTFINHIMNKDCGFKYFYIDIGKDWSYPDEPYMFFDESVHTLNEILTTISKMIDKREEIWNRFISLGSNPCSKRLDLAMLSTISSLKKLKLGSTWEELITDIILHITDNFSERNCKNYTTKQNYGRIPIVISLIMLLICAVSITENTQKSNSFSIIFDNLDVITNPAIPAENVMNLWSVIDKYILFKQIIEATTNVSLPDFQIIITVRKVLYSHIVSHLPDLEMLPDYNQSNVNICDISNLYSSQEVLAHRITYWNQNGKKEINEKLSKLKTITSVHDNNSSIDEDSNQNDYDLKSTINIDAFLNHNYRAFSNILSALIDNTEYYNIVIRDFNKHSSSKDWQKVSTIVFLISLIYRKEKVWNSLGFGCKDFNTTDYPTTLNRLILNYLYLAKRGKDICQFTNSNIKNIPDDNYVSLEDLIKALKNTTFLIIKTDDSEKKIEDYYKEQFDKDSQELIIERLADMCARNPMSVHSKVSGYDSDDDELWRRPLYFIGGVKLNHTASSSKELKLNFEESILKNRANQILFSITDEGYILIRDIVASFEFYSARYCNEKKAKPLHHAANTEEINILVRPVYYAIKKCCERNYTFENQYSTKYNLTNDEYLLQFFHPRTNPRYKRTNNLIELRNRSFRPQLHIVRVIYNHILYFDNLKENISISNNPEKNEMCKCLTRWIESYLKLYKKHFFDLLNKTICNSDNNVYRMLLRLLQEQKKHYSQNGDYQNVNIRIKRANKGKKGSENNNSSI